MYAFLCLVSNYVSYRAVSLKLLQQTKSFKISMSMHCVELTPHGEVLNQYVGLSVEHV